MLNHNTTISEDIMQHIILLHGLGSHGITMRFLKAYIDIHTNHSTHDFSYYSITSNIDQIVSHLEDRFNLSFSYSDEVCIIGHSLGGIIAAKLASSDQLRCKVSQIITLGSPHRGALLANKILAKIPLISKVFPIVHELSTKSNKMDYSIKSYCKIGVIAGNKYKSSWNPLIILGKMFLGSRGIHDGVVGIHENGMSNITDYACIHVDHVNMLWSPKIADMCISFINTSKF